MAEGPFQAMFEEDTTGVIRREIVTYRMKSGVMVKETAFRDYYSSGDYHDSLSTTPLQER